jgi:hypothetical protein
VFLSQMHKNTCSWCRASSLARLGLILRLQSCSACLMPVLVPYSHRVHKQRKSSFGPWRICLAFLPSSMVSHFAKYETPYSHCHSPSKIISSDRLDLEMQCYQGEHQRLKILDEIVEDTQTFRVLRFCDVDKRSNFSSLNRDQLVN